MVVPEAIPDWGGARPEALKWSRVKPCTVADLTTWHPDWVAWTLTHRLASTEAAEAVALAEGTPKWLRVLARTACEAETGPLRPVVANLCRADLREARLDGADLTGTVVRDASFRGATGLTAEQVAYLHDNGAVIP